MRASRQLLAPLALACLLAAAGTAHAGRALLQFNPEFRQFVQITVSLRGTCSAVLTANPTLLNDVRLAAIADVRRELTANPVGIANLTATLASLRAGTPNCTAVTDPVNGRAMAGITVSPNYNGVSTVVVRDAMWNAARRGICIGNYNREVWAQLTATLPAAFPVVYNNGSRLNPNGPRDAEGNPTFANTVPYAPVSPGPCDPVPSPSPSPSPGPLPSPAPSPSPSPLPSPSPSPVPSPSPSPSPSPTPSPSPSPSPAPVDCSGIPNSIAVNGTCLCADPVYTIEALNGTTLAACLLSNSTACPIAFPLPSRDVPGNLLSCSTAGTACPAGALTLYNGTATVECRVGGTACQFSVAGVLYSVPVQSSPSNALVGCVANGATACPAAFPVAFAEQPAWAIQRCTNQTACPPYVSAVNTRFFVPGFSVSNQLVACLTTNFGSGQTGTCPQVTGLNFTVNSIDTNPTGVAGSPAQWTVACLAAGATCPGGQPLRFYGRTTSAPTQTFCSPVPAGGCASNPAFAVPPYPTGTDGTYGVNITSSGVLLGCIINGVTVCPADFPVATFNANGAITGCGPNGTSISCPVGTIPAKNSAGITVLCLTAIASGSECPADVNGNNYPISVRDANGAILECLALGSACPVSAAFPFYNVDFSGIPTTAPAALRQCWPARTSCIWQTYTVEIRPNDGSTTLTGCVSSTAQNCPLGNALAYRAADMSLVECRPSTQTTCPTASSPAPFNLYTIPAQNSGALVACLPSNLVACPPSLYPITASVTISSAIQACLTANSQCSGEFSFFVANNNGVIRCLQPSGAANCDAVTGATIEVFGDASATNLVGCLQDGSTACPASSTFPFYAFASGAYGLNQCRPSLVNAAECPSPFTTEGLDAALAVRACINTAGATAGLTTGCPPSSLTPYSLPVGADVNAVTTALPTTCLSNAIPACPNALVGGSNRSFELFSGANAAGTAGLLAACIGPVSTDCNAVTGFTAEVFSSALGATTPVLSGCIAPATPCPLEVSLPVLDNTAAALTQCNTAGPCNNDFPVRLVRADGTTLAGCMARTAASTDCPAANTLTPGTIFNFELFGALTAGSATPALVECRPTPSPAPTNCISFGSGFSVPMYTSTDFTGTVAACAAPGVRCPAAAEVGTHYPIFLTSTSGAVITACTSGTPTCTAPLISAFDTDGTTRLGCLAATAAVPACAALAAPSNYPTTGTVTTFQFRATGADAAAAALGSCTKSTTACTTGQGLITSAGSQVGCSAFNVANGCSTFASGLSPNPYTGPMVCTTVP